MKNEPRHEKNLIASYANNKDADQPRHEKSLIVSYANNKDADQPAHPHCLNSVFVVHHLDSIISLVSISKISGFKLVSVAGQAGLFYLVENLLDRFSHDDAQII